MSLWKRLGMWLGLVAKPEPEPKAVESVSTAPGKEEIIRAELDAIVTWLTNSINDGLTNGRDATTHHWYIGSDCSFIEDVRVGIYRQVEGYYAVALGMSIAYSRRYTDYAYRYRAPEELWTQIEYSWAKQYLFSRLNIPFSWHRSVNTPLFGELSQQHSDCNNFVFVFYIGELPEVEAIEGQYTPENHEELMKTQRKLRVTYRAFANTYLKEQARWDARAFVSSLQERLADSNTAHADARGILKGTFSDPLGSNNFQGYALLADDILIMQFYNRYGNDERLRDILAWCWTLQEYHRHYQDLFQEALAETLREHNSTMRSWQVERDNLLWVDDPDARLCEMRFCLKRTYNV